MKLLLFIIIATCSSCQITNSIKNKIFHQKRRIIRYEKPFKTNLTKKVQFQHRYKPNKLQTIIKKEKEFNKKWYNQYLWQ